MHRCMCTALQCDVVEITFVGVYSITCTQYQCKIYMQASPVEIADWCISPLLENGIRKLATFQGLKSGIEQYSNEI